MIAFPQAALVPAPARRRTWCSAWWGPSWLRTATCRRWGRGLIIATALVPRWRWGLESRQLFGALIRPWPALWAVAISYGAVPACRLAGRPVAARRFPRRPADHRQCSLHARLGGILDAPGGGQRGHGPAGDPADHRHQLAGDHRVGGAGDGHGGVGQLHGHGPRPVPAPDRPGRVGQALRSIPAFTRDGPREECFWALSRSCWSSRSS